MNCDRVLPLVKFPKSQDGYRAKRCQRCYKVRRLGAQEFKCGICERVRDADRYAASRDDTPICQTCWRRRHSSMDLNSYYLLYRYGIDEAEYERLYKKQGGKCALCRKAATGIYRGQRPCKLHVDHCHETGKIRGLLCNACNLALGHFGTPEILRRALRYIR